MNLKRKLEWRVIYCTLFTNLSSLMLGYSFGFPSPIASEVKSPDLLDDYQFGIFYLSAAIGSFTAIPIMYCMSRKSVIITAVIISTVGWIILSISRVSYLLICGRVVTGLGSGLSVPLVSIYIGELANKNTRGRHLSITGISISIGLLILYSLGIGLTYKWISVVATLICIIQLLSLLVVPYTPTYLVSIGLENNALHTLQKLRSRDYDSDSEVRGIIRVVDESKMPFLSKLSLLFKLYHLKALFVVCIVMMNSRTSGINLLGSYASELLENEVIDPNIIGLSIPISQIIGSSLAIIFIEKVGRKRLLIISQVGIILSLLLMGTYLLLNDEICHQTILSNSTFVAICGSNYLITWPILTFLLFNLSFTLGVGPVSFVLLGELIPQKVKPIVSGIGAFLLFISSFILVTIYPIITIQVPRLYFLYALAVIDLLICVLILILTPESKGKSIIELEMLFQENTVFCCKKSSSKTTQEQIRME